MNRARAAFFSRGVRPGDVVYDVGANVGYYTLLAAAATGVSGRVIAFEPLPDNLKFLRQHIALNGLNQVEVIDAAVSDHAGEALFEIAASRSMGQVSERGSLPVRLVAIDELVAEGRLPPPDCLKIDVEGAELQVLAGAKNVMAQSSPDIFLATHGQELHAACCKVLVDAGYRLQALGGERIEDVDEIYATRRLTQPPLWPSSIFRFSMLPRRVLIVSPLFPPINAPDHQRVRMSLPFFEEFGWRPTVLAVRPEYVEGTDDPLLEQTLPESVEIVRTGALPVRWTRRLGLGNLGLRAFPALWRAGNRLLAKERFDAVYFSTTMFAVMALGPLWRRRFGVPYVLDFQDPWIQDYYDQPGAGPPPGGRFKHGFSQWLARRLEPLAMGAASEVITVSPAYVQTLLARYPAVAADRYTVLPFGAPERDFDSLASLDVRQTIFDPSDGHRHWVYVGRGGEDMAVALRLRFTAVAEARARDPAAWSAVRMHFVGTSYAPAGQGEKTVEPLARACGVGDLVEERTDRVPYFEALQSLRQSDAILVIGSDSPGYSASKLYPCLLARRPLLALLHADSPAVEILRRWSAGPVVTFQPGHIAPGTAEMRGALEAVHAAAGQGVTLDTEHFSAEHGARAVTARQCEVLDRALSDDRSPR